MSDLVFVTSNKFKFTHATHMLEPYDITLRRQHMDLEELQADGEAICRHKAEQAYTELRQPLVVNDDSWSIPGLGGFPGAYMKDMNNWLSSDDWLRLTLPLTDRRIILQQHIIYQDEHRQQHFLLEIEALLMKQVVGEHDFGHLTITSFDGGKTTGAERVQNGLPAVEQSTATAWKLLAEWLMK